MSPRQTAMYFREWGYVRGYCKRHRLPEPERHALHVQALGVDKSSKLFSNADFDKVLAVFRAVHQPANVAAQLRQLGEPTKRKLFKIGELLTCLGLYHPDPRGYMRSIVRDTVNRGSMLQVSEPSDLSDTPDGPSETSQLGRLVMDLSRAVNGRNGFRARAGDSIHTMRKRAGLQCRCSACAPSRRPVLAAAGGLADNEPW